MGKGLEEMRLGQGEVCKVSLRIRSQEKKINERVFILGHDKDLKDLVQIANNVVISEIRRRVEGGGNLTSRCSGH